MPSDSPLKPPAQSQRSILRHVARDLRIGENSQLHDGPIRVLEGLRAASGGDAHRRKEHELTTGGRRELRVATFGIAGFPEHLLAAQRNLVGADHDRIGAPTCNRERLCARESGGEPRRRFTVETRLIDLGCHAFKRHTEAFEQPAAMGEVEASSNSGRSVSFTPCSAALDP